MIINMCLLVKMICVLAFLLFVIFLSKSSLFLASVDGLLKDAGSFLSVRRRLRILLVLDCHHVESVERGKH